MEININVQHTHTIKNEAIKKPSDTPITPKIGEAWPSFDADGTYAGVASGNELEPDGHLVLLNAYADKDMTWADAKAWATSVGGRLPTRFESALLYANLQDKINAGNAYWTGTESQSSSGFAWCQHFNGGSQITRSKDFTLRARAVSRFPL